MSTLRVFVRLHGHTQPTKIHKIDKLHPEATSRAQLIAAAKTKLGFAGIVDPAGVRLYLDKGVDLEDLEDLEPDDIIYVAFDGAAWREPVDCPPPLPPPISQGAASRLSSPPEAATAPQPLPEHTTPALALSPSVPSVPTAGSSALAELGIGMDVRASKIKPATSAPLPISNLHLSRG